MSQRSAASPRRSALAVGAALVCTVVATWASPAGAARFLDTAGSVHEEAVDRLAAAGVTAGCDPAGARFCPTSPVLRGQLASFLVRALDLPPGSADAVGDDDGSPHEASIDRLIEDGISEGSAGGGFSPDVPVSRAQMASFLVRAFALPVGSGATRFADVAGTHAANVEALAAAGVTGGCDAAGTRYCPDRAVTREQMASFLVRALDAAATTSPAVGGPGPVVPEGGGSGATYADDVEPAALPDSDPALHEHRPVDGEVAATRAVDPADAVAALTPQRAKEATAPAVGAPPTATSSEGLRAMLFDGEPLLGGTSDWAASTVAPVGKLYYLRPDGRTGVCSGTVVTRGLVLTAAHCVVGANGDHADFVFVPAKSGTSEPFGRWGGSRAYYFTSYLAGGPRQHVYDYALVLVPPTSTGAWIGDLTGTFPVVLNSQDLHLPKTALGYPVDGWFRTWGGDHLWSCSSADVRTYTFAEGWASKGAGCNANGGFSGGPVFEFWNGAWHVGSVNSTMTHTPAGGARDTHWLMNVWGPSFNRDYDALLDAVR